MAEQGYWTPAPASRSSGAFVDLFTVLIQGTDYAMKAGQQPAVSTNGSEFLQLQTWVEWATERSPSRLRRIRVGICPCFIAAK